jgi:hypothetical protein
MRHERKWRETCERVRGQLLKLSMISVTVMIIKRMFQEPQVRRPVQAGDSVGATKADELNGHGGLEPCLLRSSKSKYSSSLSI